MARASGCGGADLPPRTRPRRHRRAADRRTSAGSQMPAASARCRRPARARSSTSSRPASRRRATRRSSSRRPISITSSRSPAAVAGRLGAVRRDARRRPRRLPPAVEHELPRQPVDRREATTRFANGVIGKLVTYNMEERQRVKIVDYVGLEEDRELEDRRQAEGSERRRSASTRSSTPALIRKVEGIVRDMMKEKGFQFANVTHEIKDVPGGPKLVHLTFNMDEGPEGQDPEHRLRRQQGDQRRHAEAADEGQQAQRLVSSRWSSTGARHLPGSEVRRRRREGRPSTTATSGYIRRGRRRSPSSRCSATRTTRRPAWIELRIPVTEGERYKVGELRRSPATRSSRPRSCSRCSSSSTGRVLQREEGPERAREGAGDLRRRRLHGVHRLSRLQARATSRTRPSRSARGARRRSRRSRRRTPPPIVDVTMRMQEGKQYFVNRITFTGNTTTRDNVIRREMRLVEDGVFNTEALKFSIKRLNQLGYFKALEGRQGRQRRQDAERRQQGRREAEARRAEPQPAHLRRRRVAVRRLLRPAVVPDGRTSSAAARASPLSLQAGSRAQNYQLAFTEPFLFDRNITGGVNLFKTDVRYIGQFTQKSTGGVLTFGFPLGSGFTRDVHQLQLRARARHRDQRPVHAIRGAGAQSVPARLAADRRRAASASSARSRRASSTTPSTTRSSRPAGKRYTASIDLAGLGGNTNFYKPTLEGVWYWKQNNRLTLGLRASWSTSTRFNGTDSTLPIFEKLFLGGEYSVRGFDIRTIGPMDPTTGLVLGGNKSLLFNVEEMINIAGPVRLIFFYDAGQVRDVGQPFTWFENVRSRSCRPVGAVGSVCHQHAGGPELSTSAGRAHSRPRRAQKSASSCRC